MTQISLFNQSPKAITMTSREIADLLECRHDNVKRTIERLAERGVIELPPMEEIKTATNIGTVYLIGKRDSYVIVAQLSPEFTARLVDRWQELEAKQMAVIPNFEDPIEAAQAWIEQYKEKQALLEKVAEDAPKVAFHDAVTDATNCQTIEEVAKSLGTGRNRLYAFLRHMKVLMGNNLPYQKFIDDGKFKVVERMMDNGLIYPQTLVTGKGMPYVQRLWAMTNGLVPV